MKSQYIATEIKVYFAAKLAQKQSYHIILVFILFYFTISSLVSPIRIRSKSYLVQMGFSNPQMFEYGSSNALKFAFNIISGIELTMLEHGPSNTTRLICNNS